MGNEWISSWQYTLDLERMMERLFRRVSLIFGCGCACGPAVVRYSLSNLYCENKPRYRWDANIGTTSPIQFNLAFNNKRYNGTLYIQFPL
jgi:hypothetical protein